MENYEKMHNRLGIYYKHKTGLREDIAPKERSLKGKSGYHRHFHDFSVKFYKRR
jgi:hypothetical protein